MAGRVVVGEMAIPKLDRAPNPSEETKPISFPMPPEAVGEDEAPPTRRAPVPSLERVSNRPPTLPPVSHTRIKATARAALGVLGAAMALLLTACPGNSIDPDVPRSARVTRQVTVLVGSDGRGAWESVTMDRDGCFESTEERAEGGRVVARGCLDERDVAGWFARVDDLADGMRMIPSNRVERGLRFGSPEVLLVGADGRSRVAREDDDAARLVRHARPLLAAVDREGRRVDERRRFDWRRADDDDRFATPPPGR